MTLQRTMYLSLLALLISISSTESAHADTVQARCDVYDPGEDHAKAMVACTFSQRQGAVGIQLENGPRYDLRPTGDSPGNYLDSNGDAAYRQSGLGDQGTIFRMKDASIFVYWNTAALNPPDDESNWTAPYTTADYDATTRLPCGPLGEPEKGSCPAGILRMEDGQASIVVTSPSGAEFTLNFMKDYVNASNREVTTRKDGDTWIVDIDQAETYRVPVAAIEGG